MLGLAILILVTAQRLSELVIARRNTATLLKQGANEVGASHYKYIVMVHAAWLISLFALSWNRPVSLGFLVIYLALQILRFWTLTSLGKRWTTKIIVVPGEKLVTAGPYRYLKHPNYVVVIGEIACLPLVFGLWQHALIFSILNAVVLWHRIRTENLALAGANGTP